MKIKRTTSVWLLLVLPVFSGCSSVNQAQLAGYLKDKPKELHPDFQKVVVEGERNQVLNRLRAGLKAMEYGHNSLASRTFDEALLTIETIYGGDEKAKQARAMFTAEDRKVFRGEPYERAMAFYYRGILYLMESDYENARASFKSGSLQDTLAEEEKYQQDFALLEFLEGWASHCNGNNDLAREAYASAKKHASSLVVPASTDNLLVLAELGYSPVKYLAGDHGELLEIKGNSKQGPAYARVRLTDGFELLDNQESILQQAMDRGRRQFADVLENKAKFKESAAEVADATAEAATGAAVVATTAAQVGDFDTARTLGGAGALLGIFSVASQAVSSATQTAADTRHWDNLPEKVAYGTYHRNNDSTARPAADFGDDTPPTHAHYAGDDSCTILWVRSQSDE